LPKSMVGAVGRQPTASVDDVILPIIRSDERWGPPPGRLPHQIPPHTNRIPHPGTYIRRPEDHRTQLPLEEPHSFPEWEIPGPKHEMSYVHEYDDGRMTVIRGPDEIYRRDRE
jgi:hypothetical protein